jgi:hypothetical protein
MAAGEAWHRPCPRNGVTAYLSIELTTARLDSR